MFADFSNELIYVAGGAFLIGWILATIVSRLGARYRARKRDPRDNRIRELEAAGRIAAAEAEKSAAKISKLSDEVTEAANKIERRDNVISEQKSKLERYTNDLKESVIKTRQLRSELTERATENVHAEAKIREVETELSVAQASTDMIATGVLDYSLIPDNPDSRDVANLIDPGPASAKSKKVSG
jgi:predicted RNase H-like nuclease (RuvC/YqgF family)